MVTLIVEPNGIWDGLLGAVIGVASTSYNGCTQEASASRRWPAISFSATGFSYDASGNVLTDGTQHLHLER